MSPMLYSLLLLAATAVAYLHIARSGRTRVSICRCGDLIDRPALPPTRCPSCGALII